MVLASLQHFFIVFVAINVIYGLPQPQPQQNVRGNGARQIQPNDFGFNPEFQGVFINHDNDSDNPNLIGNDMSSSTQRPTTAFTSRPVLVVGDASTTTTASPQYRSCVRACQSIAIYNPVCASDGTTYDNRQRLDCARRCGANIELVRGGTCSPLR